VKRLQSITTKDWLLADFLCPSQYDNVVRAVLQIREKNKQMAVTLGPYVKKAVYLQLAEFIKCGSEEGKKKCKEFLNLYNASWTEEVSSSTVRLQQLSKIQKTVLLPSVKDLQKLTNYIDLSVADITRHPHLTSADYTKLQKLVVSSLILFNKRRPAEVTDITVADYRCSLEQQEDREEILSSLTPEEKALAGRYSKAVYYSCALECPLLQYATRPKLGSKSEMLNPTSQSLLIDVLSHCEA
jgi:hypothetical protein